jgi:hypothetical protein
MFVLRTNKFFLEGDICMLPKYDLYLDKETRQMEIHEEECKQKNKKVKEGKILLRNHLGMASNKQEVYNKYKNSFPLQIINLPECCE